MYKRHQLTTFTAHMKLCTLGN